METDLSVCKLVSAEIQAHLFPFLFFTSVPHVKLIISSRIHYQNIHHMHGHSFKQRRRFAFDQSGSWSQAKCFWQQPSGAGWHYSTDGGVRSAPLKIGKEEGGAVQGRGAGEKSVFVLSVCGDEDWEGGKVNMGHSSGLRHVLPSGWKRKWLGPITAFSSFLPLLLYNWSHSWWDVPLWRAFSSVQRLLLWPRFISKTLAGEKNWSQSVLTGLRCVVPVIHDSSHANLIYIIQRRQDEKMVSHIAGLSAWVAFGLHF